MPTSVTDKLSAIIAQIEAQGSANLLRLTVLKKWFEHSGRLTAFSLWVARRAAEGGDVAKPGSELLREAQALLRQTAGNEPNPVLAAGLYHRLQAFQDTYHRGEWGPIRIVRNANLLVIEDALAIYLWHANCPSLGYKLAVSYAAYYDPHYGNSLNGPSRDRLLEIVDFVRQRKAGEAAATKPETR